ncbi:MAG: DUF423 domain-containing protein [Candidatus Kapaibacteriales bacterium]
MSPKQISVIGALFMAFSVGIGAFGAHGLSEILEVNGRIDTYATAMDYFFIHSFAILVIGLFGLAKESDSQKSKFSQAVILFIIGIVLFSGSLIALSITNIGLFGAITPFGGLSFIAGWIMVAVKLGRGGKS